MGILTQLIEQRAHPSMGDPALLALFGGGQMSAAGVRVTSRNALGVPAVLSATRILSESIASIPLHLYRRLEPRGRQRATEHGVYELLHGQPNPWQTSFEWREMMQGHLTLRGNAYNAIVENGGGEIVMLVPLHPDRVSVKIEKLAANMPPVVLFEWRPLVGPPAVFFADEVLHLRGLSDDGITGLSVLELARNTFGSAIALEEYSSRFYANHAEPGGILTHPKKLSADAKEKLRQTWQDRHGGSANRARVAVLEEGLKWESVGVSNKDAEFLASRKFTVTDIARIFRIPPHMLGDLEHATFSNIEHQGIEFTTHTIRPWAVRWEQRLRASLLTPTERQTLYVEFNLDGLSRGDQPSRYSAYAVGRQWGWLSANDVREFENMNPLPDAQGDEYLVPLNMLPAGATPPTAPAALPAAPAPKQRGLLGGGQEHRSLVVRDRLRSAFGHVFRETVARALRGQVSAARRVLDKAIASNDVETFRAWLEDHTAAHADFVTRTLHPVMLGYAEALQGEAAYEVNGIAGMTTELEQLVQLAADGAGIRESRALSVAVAPFLDPGASVEGLRAVQALLADWEPQRAAAVASVESVRLGAEVARFTYRAAGVIGVVWVQRDQNPHCAALHNRIASIDAPFLNAGDVVEAAGSAPLTMASAVRHPPLTDRCTCMITPQRSA